MPRRKTSAKNAAPAAPNTRPLRVGEEIRHALAAILARGELHDPELAGRLITVSEVRVAPDLMHATAYVSELGAADVAGLLKALKRAAPYLRREVVKEVKLRRAPELAFAADTSFEYARRIDSVLRDPAVRRDLDEDGQET